MATNLNIVLTAQTSAATAALNKATKSTDRLTDSINRSRNSARKMGNQFNSTAVRMNKFGKGVAQQAGYQIADFAVQVGNGTSAIQAFGQQGSQMLAVFGPIGSIIGAGVAVFSALALVAQKSGSSFLGFSDSVDSVDDAIKKLDRSLTQVGKTYKSDIPASLALATEAFEGFEGNIQDTINLIRQQKLQAAFRDLNGAIASFDENIKGSTNSQQKAIKLQKDLAKATKGLTAEQVESSKIVQQIRGALRQHSSSILDLGEDYGEFTRGYKEYKNILNEITSNENLSVKVIKEKATRLLALATSLDGAGGAGLGLFEATKKFSDLFGAFKGEDKVKEIKSSFNEATDSIKKQTEELRVQNELFGQSEAIKIREIQLLQLYKEIQSGIVKLDSDQINARLAAISDQFKQNQLAEKLKKNEEDRLKNSREAAIAAKKAASEKEAFERKLAAEFKKQTQELNRQVDTFAQTLKSIESQTEEFRIRNQLFGKSKNLIESELIFRKEIERLTKDGNKLTLEEIDAVRTRIDELLREKEILTEKQEIQKAIDELFKQQNKDRQKANKEIEKEQKRINDLMKEGFREASDAIAGLIDKTSSWRDVLSAVLKKVIDIASKMGTTKSGGFSFDKLFKVGATLLGNVFGGPSTSVTTGGSMGGHPYAFHNGGMIGKNSGVNMRSDERMIIARTGERVLNRGQAMMSEQGGTGGGVVVNQTINISTGVQQTVRAEIMSMAPQIAAQAKSAVLDARRRGGGFSAAFA